jgi:four helix bundle protein
MIKLEDLEVYKVAMEIGDIVWEIVEKWNYYQKDTLGKQFTRSADSIALNISEGYGRFHYAENRFFSGIAEAQHLKQVQLCKKRQKENFLQMISMNF